MPAGDLITADWQAELRGALTGFGTSYAIGTAIGGLDVPEAKGLDTDLGHAPGAYSGRDYTGVRIITIPYILKGTPAAVGDSFWTLSGIWAASETNMTLHLRVPGYGQIMVNGRPRALTASFEFLNVGHIAALASFFCGDPTLYRTPRAPTIGTATAGVGQATANWAAPADNGGAAVTGYEVTTYRASDSVVLFTNSPGNVLTYTRTGLSAGVAVYFKVAAKQAVGTGAQSAASNTVTPT